MKFLIVGLGNPEPQYLRNRHNIGFMVLDEIATDKDVAFDSVKYGWTAKVRNRGKQLILLKPNTYMNLSGKAVRFHMEKEKIKPSQILIITDDIAIPFGSLRMRAKGSSAGHNGLQNIIEVLGHQNFPRLRFGVGSEFSKGRQVDYVLADFPPEERDQLPKLMKKAIDMTYSFTFAGINQTMSNYND